MPPAGVPAARLLCGSALHAAAQASHPQEATPGGTKRECGREACWGQAVHALGTCQHTHVVSPLMFALPLDLVAQHITHSHGMSVGFVVALLHHLHVLRRVRLSFVTGAPTGCCCMYQLVLVSARPCTAPHSHLSDLCLFRHCCTPGCLSARMPACPPACPPPTAPPALRDGGPGPRGG